MAHVQLKRVCEVALLPGTFRVSPRCASSTCGGDFCCVEEDGHGGKQLVLNSRSMAVEYVVLTYHRLQSLS